MEKEAQARGERSLLRLEKRRRAAFRISLRINRTPNVGRSGAAPLQLEKKRTYGCNGRGDGIECGVVNALRGADQRVRGILGLKYRISRRTEKRTQDPLLLRKNGAPGVWLPRGDWRARVKSADGEKRRRAAALQRDALRRECP